MIDEKITRLQEKLNTVKYRNNFRATILHMENIAAYRVILRIDTECAYKRNGETLPLVMPTVIFYEAIDGILINFNTWIRSQIRKIEHHEIDEWLLINDKRIFDPHKNDKTL